MTPLDRAHKAMEDAPDNDALRLRFFERLADAELFVLLEGEAEEDSITPRLFPLEDGTFVLAFDTEDRLAELAPYGAFLTTMSGRTLVRLLVAEGLGLGVNLDVAPSSILLPPEAVAWLAETLDHAPEDVAEIPDELYPPTDVPEALLTGLDAKLSSATGAAKAAYLATVRYKRGNMGHLLAFVAPVPGTERGLARAVSEALTFSGLEAGSLDVTFLDASDEMAARLARVGLRFDLPEIEAPKDHTPKAPGMDPDKPPRLR